MMVALYRSKKDMKSYIVKPLRYQETSMFGNEYKQDGVMFFVGPSATERRFFGQVTMEGGLIKKVV